ncbi:hypothetical protein GP486_004742, partial [Trichoglossum hirsutum]
MSSKQTALSFVSHKRPALSDPELKPTPKKPRVSPTLEELSKVTREQALATVERLKVGYKDKSGASYEPAKSNEIGCVLAQKGTNREENGYVQIAPLVDIRTRARKGETKKPKARPQNAHRLVVIAHKRHVN